MQHYYRVLAQRNYLLRTAKKSGQGLVDSQVMEPWNTQLVDLGSQLRLHRLEALNKLRAPFLCYYGRFALAGEEAAVVYQGTKEQDLEALRAELRRITRAPQGAGNPNRPYALWTAPR